MATRINAYDRAIRKLYDELMKMGNMANDLLSQALTALLNQDVVLAEQIMKQDDAIDNMLYSIELRALDIISLQQPSDADLRILASVIRISKDLERIADQAVNIAEITIKLAEKGSYFKPLVDIPRMGELVKEMVRKSIVACTEQDIKLANDVNDEDVEVDRIYSYLFDELLEVMKKTPENIDQAFYLSHVSRYLERIGDHAVNIAEMVIYMVTGNRRPFDDK